MIFNQKNAFFPFYSQPLFLPWILSFTLVPACCLWADASSKESTRIVTTIPELAWIVEKLTDAPVESLLTGQEDAHYLNVVPSHIRRIANADLLISVGLDLEVGYLPTMIKKAANLKLSRESSRHLVVGDKIKIDGKITHAVDRSDGDVHPHGNPHFWLSALKMIEATEAIEAFLVQYMPSQASSVRSRALTLSKRLKDLHSSALKQCEPVGSIFAEYHNEFHYFLADYDLKSVGHLEDKPGLPPSGARIKQFSEFAKKSKVNLLLAAKNHPRSVLNKFSHVSGIPHVQVSTIMPKGQNYETHFLEQFLSTICSQ